MSSKEHQERYGKIPEVELPEDREQLRWKLVNALLDFWTLAEGSEAWQQLIWARIAVLVAAVERALNMPQSEEWMREHFVEPTDNYDGRIAIFFYNFISLHKERKQKNRLLTIVMALLSSSLKPLSAPKMVSVSCLVLDALPDESFNEATLEFLEVVETPTSFFAGLGGVGENLLAVASEEVGELYNKRGDRLAMKDILAAARRPMSWAKKFGSPLFDGSSKSLWIKSTVGFVQALAKTKDGLLFIAKDLGRRPAKQQLFWPDQGFPETLCFGELPIERKAKFLEAVLCGKYEDRFAMVSLSQNCIEMLSTEERASGLFDTMFLTLCKIYCWRNLWREGKFYQNLLERALSGKPEATLRLFLAYLKKELETPIPEDDMQRKSRMGELANLFHYLRIVGVHRESIRSEVLALVHRCEEIGPIVSQYPEARSAMNTALAKIAHCWKERAGDLAGHLYAVEERIVGYSNWYLINEALLGGHAGLELARILGGKFLREMRERVLELEADKSGPLPLNYLVVLEACGASAGQLLGVEQSLEDCRWMLKMPLE